MTVPSISQQPVSATVTEGQDTNFAVVASGTPPITYQWQRNGQAIEGATQSSLALSSVAFYEDGDRFSVVVSNGAGQIASEEVALRVDLKPKLALCGAAFVVRANGTLWSWGTAAWQLGRETTDIDSQIRPQPVLALGNVVNVACGDDHALALLRDGTIRAWGRNHNGQLGDGTRTDQPLPVIVSGLTEVVAITAGGGKSYALRRDGSLWLWGTTSYRYISSDIDPAARLAPESSPTPEPLVALTVGYGYRTHTGVAIGRSGQLYFLGEDLRAERDDRATARDSLTAIDGITDAVAVSAGPDAAFVLRSDRSLWAWGSGLYGQLGNGQTGYGQFASRPQVMPGLPKLIGVAAGKTHQVFTLDVNGRLWSWGLDDYGVLGRDVRYDGATPIRLDDLIDVETVVAGSNAQAMAMTRDGRIWGWGYNSSSTLGVPYSQAIMSRMSRLIEGVTGR